jgi:hypothetical protein
LNADFNAYPDPPFNLNADPDPASQIMRICNPGCPLGGLFEQKKKKIGVAIVCSLIIVEGGGGGGVWFAKKKIKVGFYGG